MRRPSFVGKIAFVVGFSWAVSCVKNPVTGNPELSLVSRSEEIAIGKEAAEEVLQQIGPYDKPELAAYVSEIGQRIAKTTERPDLPWSFNVIDDPAVNAFALPGGQIFLTRGILSYMTSEAELATVMGHECGHVAAKHSVSMITRTQMAELGLGLGSVFVPGAEKVGGLLGAGLQILFLRYSRENEKQADDLGFRYALALGYDARAMRDLFTMLDAVGKREGGRLPEWLATHPNPENRLQRVDEKIAALTNMPWNERDLGRERYLRRIDGIVFGENKRLGYVRESTFIHPELGFRVDFPSGWAVQNQRDRVVAVNGDRTAALGLAIVPSRSPDQAAREFFSSPDVREVSNPAGGAGGARYFQARTESGTVGGIVSFFAFGQRTYQFLGYTGLQRLPSYDEAFRKSLASFGPVNDPKLLDVQVARVQIAPVPGDMTLQEFQKRFPSIVSIEELALINGTAPDRPLMPGQLVKKVVTGSAKTAHR